MDQRPQVKIISYNLNGAEVCASAARISTTRGNAMELFEKARDNPKNEDLIKKVLRSGHKSLIEHAVFTLAFWNVSAFVEQYLIECRLASFTVKSRRYVDFGGFGYHLPSGLEPAELEDYRQYMDLLFSAYGSLIDAGIPKEDARFVLPYSFHSNFYCTVNARELIHIIRSIRFGRGRDIPELSELAGQLASQLRSGFPFLTAELDCPPSGGPDVSGVPACPALREEPLFVEPSAVCAVRLVSAPSDPMAVLRAAWEISGHPSGEPFCVERLLASPRPRELEQLSYSFIISDVTLSGITHIVRHRMQSVIVPSIRGVDHGRYILPDSIKADPAALHIYRSALTAAYDILKKPSSAALLEKYGYYFAVSGNMMTVMTTMNARELELFIRLRACSRAQWEIRSAATAMLRLLRAHFPELYGRFGPSCFILGSCPEGPLTCGHMSDVRSRFSDPSIPAQ